MYITCTNCEKNITSTGICVACEPERVSEMLGLAYTDRANLNSYISVVEDTCNGLKIRQQELLQTIRNLSSSVPYAEEAGNAATLIAEVGTLRARVAEVERERDTAVVRAMVAEVERDEALRQEKIERSRADLHVGGYNDASVLRSKLEVAEKRIQFLESEVRRYDDEHNESVSRYQRTLTELAAVNREIERWRHGAPIESDFVCPNELLLHQILGPVR